MALYVKTLHLVNTKEEAELFNDNHAEASEIYYEEYAFAYGSQIHGVRFQNLVIDYDGPRNSKYELYVASAQRKDITF